MAKQVTDKSRDPRVATELIKVPENVISVKGCRLRVNNLLLFAK